MRVIFFSENVQLISRHRNNRPKVSQKKEILAKMMIIINGIMFGWLFVLTNAKFRCHNYNKIDMAILLDNSASVAEDQFAATKKFAADLVKHFDTAKDRTNVTALSFSQYVDTGREFTDDASQESVLEAIDGLSYEGSYTRLDFALETLQGKTFDKAHGARSSNKDVKKVVVAVTDGFSSRGIEITKMLADQLKRNKVKLFSVGISTRVNKPELDELSSKLSSTHQLIVDQKKNHFTKRQVEQLAMEICKTK